MRLRSLHMAYHCLHPSGVVHWVPEQLLPPAFNLTCQVFVRRRLHNILRNLFVCSATFAQHFKSTIVPSVIKAVTGACKLIDGCSLALCSATDSVVLAGICHINKVNSIAWLYRRAQPKDSILLHHITVHYSTECCANVTEHTQHSRCCANVAEQTNQPLNAVCNTTQPFYSAEVSNL